jgi:hypothetical protein
MKILIKSTVMLLFMFICLNQAHSQVTNDSILVKIETKDGNEFIGRIISEDAAHMLLYTNELGQLDIPMGFIKTRTTVNASRIVDGSLWFDNPQSSRYFWSPNGYGLKKGEGYYQNIWVLYNQVSVGVTDYFSIGAGIVPLFLFAGTSTPIWVIPKFSIPVVKDKFNLGIGVIAGVVAGETNAGFGILYGVATLGNRDHNVNIGLGWGYAAGSWAQRPLISVSGTTRLSARSYLISENYYINLDDHSMVLLSLGGRSFIKKVGIDYFLVAPLESGIDNFFAIPVLGITIPFGNYEGSVKY